MAKNKSSPTPTRNQPPVIIVDEKQLKIAGINRTAIVGHVARLKITNEKEYALAVKLFDLIKDRERLVDLLCDENIENWRIGHKHSTTQKRNLKSPYLSARAIIGPKMAEWDTKRKIEFRKDDAVAKKDVIKQEKQIRKDEAAAARSAGDKDLAKEILSAALDTPASVLAPPPEPDNLTYRFDWHCEVLNLMRLVRAVADGTAALKLIQPNMTTLNAQASLFKKTMKIPGCKAVEKKTPIKKGDRS